MTANVEKSEQTRFIEVANQFAINHDMRIIVDRQPIVSQELLSVQLRNENQIVIMHNGVKEEVFEVMIGPINHRNEINAERDRVLAEALRNDFTEFSLR